MLKRKPFILFFILMTSTPPMAAQTFSRTLDEVVAAARYSARAVIARSDSLITELESRSFRAGYFPHIIISATTPGITNNIMPITLPDGSEQFVHRFYMNSSVSLSITQKVPFTGGNLSLSGGLTRLDNFLPQRNASFNLSLFNLSYTQSLSFYNADKWDRMIHSKQTELSTVTHKKNMENTSAQATEFFFNLLEAQKNDELQRIMIERADRLAIRAEQLRITGKISEADRLDALIDRETVRNEDNKSETVFALETINAFLGEDNTLSWTANFDYNSIPDISPFLDEELIISRAIDYSMGLQRQTKALQEKKETARAKAGRLPSISLSLSGGSTSSSKEIVRILDDRNNIASAYVSFSFPILDWGQNKFSYQTALEEERKSEIEYEQNVHKFRAETKKKLSDIRQIRRTIDIDRDIIHMLWIKYGDLEKSFQNGKTDFTRLAETRKQIYQSERNLIKHIAAFYQGVYQFRKESLYDIISNTPI